MAALALSDLTAALLDAARRAGAEAADAVAVSGAALSVDWRQRALEQALREETLDLGLRVFIGQRQACVSASDKAPGTLVAMAERAVAMAREAPEDPYAGLASPGELAKAWDVAALALCDESPAPGAVALEALAAEAEAAALSAEGVTQAETGAHYARHDYHMAATNGFAGGYARTSHSVSAVAFVGGGNSGMERDYAGESRIWRADMPGAAGIGALAAERALARLGARKPPTGHFPVLYDERVAGSLIGHLLSAINGAAIARGASWLSGAMGQAVLPPGLSLLDEPLRPRGPASRPFDGEGLPSQARPWVEKGVLQSWVLDLASARKLGLASTGHAARGTGAPPSPSPSNVTLTQGAQDRAALLAQMGRGLWVTGLIGATINPTTGDYSRGASGFWVENGQIAYPVNECTIAGNLRDMLKSLLPANDARPHLSLRVPSLLVEGLTIAGA